MPASVQGATFSIRGQMYRGHKSDCLRNLITPFVRQETPADDNEVRILECRALVQRTASTRLDITRGLYVG